MFRVTFNDPKNILNFFKKKKKTFLDASHFFPAAGHDINYPQKPQFPLEENDIRDQSTGPEVGFISMVVSKSASSVAVLDDQSKDCFLWLALVVSV